jgi:hypothetical protein
MTPILDDSATFRIHVTAAAPAAPLAILSIASILGIEPQQAADRLASLPTVLAEGVAPPVARRLSALLTALGMRVRLDPTLSPIPQPTAMLSDIAVQAKVQPTAEQTRRLAAAVLLPEDEVLNRLRCPGGLLLRDRTAAEIEALRHALRRERSLRVIVSAQPTAVCDAFRRAGAPRPLAEIVRLGLGPCRLTGAIASGMNRATAACLLRRTGDSLMVLDRAFQRFDLYLVAAHGMEDQELERFLASRPTKGVALAAGGIRWLDRDLSRKTGLQFIADYAAIGLEVRARLRTSDLQNG